MTRPASANERFLSRWSRLKRAHAGDAERASGAAPAEAGVASPSSVATPATLATPAAATCATAATSAAAAAATPAAATPAAGATAAATRAPTTPAAGEGAPALPAIESLTIDSDYAQFFQPNVSEALRRAAVKKLFADPHFNIMDGLDTYIDDYSKPDPIPPEMLARLVQARDIIDHPSNSKPENAGPAPGAADIGNGEAAAVEQPDAPSAVGQSVTDNALEQPDDIATGQQEPAGGNAQTPFRAP